MVFSSAKWSDASEIQPFVSVSSGLDFETMQAPLRNAFEMFIRPLVGDAMVADIITYYGKTSPTAKELRLVQLVQRANALLAFWYDYDEMQVMISDSGVKRQESEQSKTPYKYQEQQLKAGWKTKGFNALDDVLVYLEAEKATFTHYNANALKTEIVRSAAEVDQYYFIAGSRILYLRLRPHFRTVINTVVAPRLGTIYTDMLTEIVKTSPTEKYIKLRESLIPVVVFYAVARLIRETGSLTDKGLFFESLRNSDDAVSTSLVSDDRMSAQATQAEADAIAYWTITEKLLKASFGVTTQTGNRTPKRDNTEKKAFWG